MNKGGKRKRDGKWKEVNESECWNLWSVVNVFTGETYSYSHARPRINFQERTAARVNHPCGATEWNTPSPRSPGQSKRVEFKLSTLNYPLSRSSRKDLFPGSLSNPFDRSISSITTNFLIFNLEIVVPISRISFQFRFSLRKKSSIHFELSAFVDFEKKFISRIII